MEKPTDEQRPKGPGILGVIQSVVGAAFGVQTSRRHSEDTRHGKAGVYVAAGIVFTLIFVVTVAMVVRMVLASATG